MIEQQLAQALQRLEVDLNERLTQYESRLIELAELLEISARNGHSGTPTQQRRVEFMSAHNLEVQKSSPPCLTCKHSTILRQNKGHGPTTVYQCNLMRFEAPFALLACEAQERF